MNRLMYELFLKDNFNYLSEEEDNGFIKTGSLVDMRTGQKIPIRNYIPRFSDEQYCQSFGFQWKKFSDLQHDTKTGMSFSYERLSQNTKWDLDEVSGASVLECGCGPGRFTEILTKKFGFTVAVDMTKAVDINLANIKKQKNLLLLQADFTKMEFFSVNLIMFFVTAFSSIRLVRRRLLIS